MKSSINTRLTDISLTYIFFIAIVIIPNLVLGFYGYSTIRGHETESEENKKKGYEVIVKTYIGEINTEIEKSDENFINTMKFKTVEEMTGSFDGLLQNNKCYQHFIFVEKGGKFTFQKSANVVTKDNFEKNYRNELLSRIEDYAGKYPTRFIIDSEVDNKRTTFFCFNAVLANKRAVIGKIVLMYDQQEIFRQIIKKRFESLEFGEGVKLKLHQSVNKNVASDRTWFTIGWLGSIFPYWDITLEVEKMEDFRNKARSTSTLFLMIFALLFPLIGGALFGLRYKLLKDMRVAHLKTDFISRVTHELRTPLTSIKMFSEMLVMESIPEEQKKNCIGIIQRETERLSKLVDRVLNFSKLESRNKVFSFELADIEKIVVETVKFFEKQIPDKEFKIKLLKDQRIHKVIVDKDGIREILLNLIENSYKYSGDDKQISVKIQKDENVMKIFVIDNGFGIPREDLGRIFQKFYRVDDQINRAIDGTGLGLSICRDIAKAHGGDIKVESERGAGSKFILSIPIKFRPAQWAKYLVKKKYPWE
ncbi:MAG: HAMP domain-containing histidine kinase [Planctomycetes bacterium]|nr:HAMP domain-containing histidine kinase [Planctomycetota bacterium]